MPKGRPLRILATAFDYRPTVGGVATCAFHLLRALSLTGEVQLRVLAPAQKGDLQFDQHHFFETIRCPLPTETMKAILPFSRYLLTQARSWRPDAVLDFLWLPGGVASFLSLKMNPFLNIPYFTLAHGVEVIEATSTFRKRMRGLFSPVKRAVFKNAAGVFSVSHFTKSLLVSECGVPGEKVHVVFNGVNSKEFFPDTPAEDLLERHHLQGKNVFLTVTRLDDYKGVDRALAALRKVIPHDPNLMYLIIGEGNDRSRLESIARHYQVQGHVQFLGKVPFERLRDYYNLAKCFILLSRTDWETPNFEGFGIVFLEAAACGKPSIAGESGGIPDAVVHGQTGWLVDPQDDQAIARAMLEVLSSPQRCMHYGEAARERAIQSFSWEKIANHVLAEMRRYVRN